MAWLAAALVLAPAAARAQVSFTAAVPGSGELIASGVASNLVFTVNNSGTLTLGTISFRLSNPINLSKNLWTPPPGWTCNMPGQSDHVTCTASSCAAQGLAPNAQATFTFVATARRSQATDTVQTTDVSGTSCSNSTASVTVGIPIRVLSMSGSSSPANLLAAPNTATLSWTVTSYSTASQTNVAVTPAVIPATGASGSCPIIPTLNPGQVTTITCTYSFTAAGTYTFTGRAQNGAATASSPVASAGTIAVGTAHATWTSAAVASGRSKTYSLSLTVNNSSGATVNGVDVQYPAAAGWTVSSARATGGLFSSGNSSPGHAIFSAPPGSGLAPGASSDLVLTLSDVPAVSSTTPYPFVVKLTPTEGDTYAVSLPAQQVVVVAPIRGVTAFTVDNGQGGRVLAWVNDPAQTGVVVFASTTGEPPSPDDFQAYTVGSNGVIHTSPTATSYTDAAGGNVDVNYRVCNHDAYHVYGNCWTGLQKNGGWLSSEVYPVNGLSNGWVHALGGNALVRAGLLPGSRIGQANNSPAMAVLDVATGARSFTPVTIPALPSINSPAAVLSDGVNHAPLTPVVFAADQGTGAPLTAHVTAVDLTNALGSYRWSTPFPGESFTAGVSGVVYAAGHPDFQRDFGTDVLFIGSATGNVYAIDGITGTSLWSPPLAVGAPVHGLIVYDPATNYIYVPTSGQGVKAYDLTGHATSAPSLLTTWPTTADAGLLGGDYRFCIRTASSRGIACLDTLGVLRVFDKTSGVLLATAFDTLIGFPSALMRISGTAGQGFVVSNPTTARVISATGTPYTIQFVGSPWSPASGAIISTPAVFADSGYYVVGASDGSLHRVSLSNGAELLPASPAITTRNTSILLAQPVYDSANARFLFGTDDGHLWAIPRWF